MAERLGNLGYIAFVKEAVAGTPLTPTFFTYGYKESLTTEQNVISDNPVAGNKFARLANLRGIRSHTGTLEMYSDPNTLTYLFDMFMTRGTVTGAGPYTWPFTFSPTANPNSFTVDISFGNIVTRFFGFGGSKFGIKWDKEEGHIELAGSALGSFHSRQIATVATTTLTLDTTFDPAPNKGLVIGDLVRIYKSSTQATLDTTIASVNADGITVTLGASAAAFAPGDTIYLRPATPTYTLLTPLLWPMAQFRPGATAAAALTAPQVRVEQGSMFDISHKFESDKGSPRSGGFDPASLIRMQGDGMLKLKKYFDTPEDLQSWQQLQKNAWVLRFFNGATSQYELRVTYHNLTLVKGVKPNLESAKIEYSEDEYMPILDTADASGIDVIVISNLPSF
jgi:hypothetical protein